MSTKLKVAVVGVGSLGTHHARIYSEMPEVELVGVFDANPARAAEVAQKFATRALTDLSEVADLAQAASVAVPTDKHHGVAVPLLKRGVHLLVEKPIADRLEDAQEMVDLAGRGNLILQVGHVERFNPVMHKLETILNNPRFIEASRLGPFPAPGPSGGRPRGTEVSVVLDLMIHDIEIILHIIRAKVREIHATGLPVLSRNEDIANARICFENGCVANVTASRISAERCRKIRLFQSDSYVSLDYQNQTGQIRRRTESGIVTETITIEKEQPLEAELESFVGCVLRRAEPVVDGRIASEALDLAIEICRVIRTRPS